MSYPKNQNYRVARHELIKKAIAKALLNRTGNKAVIEPFINQYKDKDKNKNKMRLDISVQGPAAPNGSIYMIDVSVVAINSIKSTVPDIIKKDETNKTNKKSSIYQNTQEEISINIKQKTSIKDQ